jgi:hypothetical protein
MSILDTLIYFTTYNLGQPLNIDIDSKSISLVISIKTTNQEYVNTNYLGIIRFQSLDNYQVFYYANTSVTPPMSLGSMT